MPAVLSFLGLRRRSSSPKSTLVVDSKNKGPNTQITEVTTNDDGRTLVNIYTSTTVFVTECPEAILEESEEEEQAVEEIAGVKRTLSLPPDFFSSKVAAVGVSARRLSLPLRRKSVFQGVKRPVEGDRERGVDCDAVTLPDEEASQGSLSPVARVSTVYVASERVIPDVGFPEVVERDEELILGRLSTSISPRRKFGERRYRGRVLLKRRCSSAGCHRR